MKLTHLSLFSGIGGLDLAAEWAGFTTVGQCEWADYPTKILERHWPDIPRWRDIRSLTYENFTERTGFGTVDIISGGFPCQPFSVAGNQKGKDDDRYLWPEMLRVIRELAPGWVVGENVPGILQIAADDVCKDLEREGYEVGIFNYEAAAVGATHRRERIFFVAHTKSNTRGRLPIGERAKESGPCISSQNVAYTESRESRKSMQRVQQGSWRRLGSNDGESGSVYDWWAVEPNVGRVADGIPSRLHGGGINEQNSSKESGSESGGNEEMRNVRSGKCEIEPTPLRLLRLYGREGSLHEMPCKGSCETSSYCDMCGLWKTIYPKGSQKTSQNLQHGMPCGVWETMRRETMESQWSAEPNIARVASGITNRVDRLKCLGNAVVPQQAYPIFKAIANIEKEVYE